MLQPQKTNCVPCAERAQARSQSAALIAAVPQPADLPNNAPRYIRQPEFSREFEAHTRRGGRQYSEGHRKMYTTAIEILKGSGLPRLDIMEIGTGIGYGLRQMIEADFMHGYYGIEPDLDSCTHAVKQVEDMRAVGLNRYSIPDELYVRNYDLLSLVKNEPDFLPVCDYSFCIEVIEHVPAADVPAFLAAIHARTRKTLFLSTPDAARYTHGVATTAEWKRVIKLAGFDVATISRQWTTLFVCEPRG